MWPSLQSCFWPFLSDPSFRHLTNSIFKITLLLFQNKLYPASVIHFGCQEKRGEMFVMSRVCDSSKGFHYHNSIFLLSEHFLARRFVENPSTVLDAERAVVENG